MENNNSDQLTGFFHSKKALLGLICAIVLVSIIAAVVLLIRPSKTLDLPNVASVMCVEMEQYDDRLSIGSDIPAPGYPWCLFFWLCSREAWLP